MIQDRWSYSSKSLNRMRGRETVRHERERVGAGVSVEDGGLKQGN